MERVFHPGLSVPLPRTWLSCLVLCWPEAMEWFSVGGLVFVLAGRDCRGDRLRPGFHRPRSIGGSMWLPV
jgi:hypothetical protein